MHPSILKPGYPLERRMRAGGHPSILGRRQGPPWIDDQSLAQGPIKDTHSRSLTHIGAI